ncbi:MAG: TolB family protein, partial [Planctomycetota bacterium JB042]
MFPRRFPTLGLLWLSLLALVATPTFARTDGYRLPPDDVTAIVDAPATPRVTLAPSGDRLLLARSGALPTLADLARPMLRLAGMRIDPAARGPFRTSWIDALEVVDVATGDTRTLDVGDGPRRFGGASWSPDGTRVAFTRTTGRGTELWIADAATGAARRLVGPRLNGVLGDAASFLGGSDLLLVKLAPDDAGPPPAPPAVPTGPLVQETAGRAAMNRTYQDLLVTPHDEALFAHHATSRIAVVSVAGEVSPIGPTGMYAAVEGAPDGDHLLVTRIDRPFSRAVPVGRFARTVEVWDRDGRVVKRIASRGVADEVPIGGVPTGPRSIEWVPTEPATLAWFEAQDGGDPKADAEHRDHLFVSPAPFDRTEVVARTEHRARGVAWTERRGTALLSEYDRDRRWTTTRRFDWLDPSAPGPVVDDRSIRDRYGDPGDPVRRTLPHGARVARVDGGALWLAGAGAGPEGERPFLRRLDLESLDATEVFRSPLETHTSFVGFSGDGAVFRVESATRPPNWAFGTTSGDELRFLTSFEDPHPQLTGI